MDLPSDDFNYELPGENIAVYPRQQRDHAKLLAFSKKSITHHRFSDIPDLLPPNATLIFNDTKVIAARLLFKKKTGAQIEILLLTPLETHTPIQQIMQSNKTATWKCLIRNVKKWKEGTSLCQSKGNFLLSARLISKEKGQVEFLWQPETASFSQIIETMGCVPLPPYMHRRADEKDKECYQTVYANHEGSVATPTAGLHFSNVLMDKIREKKIITEFLTLHVNGGTFQPIKTKNAFAHKIHTEQMVITKKALNTLLLAERSIIAVGTTSMRALESLYWIGVKLLKEGNTNFTVDQTTPYQVSLSALPSQKEALEAVSDVLPAIHPQVGQTSIFILPGYRFRVCKGLITNFHLPKSTLTLLVAAFVGKKWKNIYETAIHSGYQFLSYGDSSLLLP